MSDLRSALSEALASAEEPEQTTPQVQDAPIAAPEPEVKAETRARDESGKFAKKAEPAPEPAPEPVQEAPKPEVKAPTSWKPAAQEAFLKASRGEMLTADEVKLLTAEAERREGDFHKGIQEFRTHADRARSYDQAIAPFQQHLQALGVDAPTAISSLLKADYTLRNSDPVSKRAYFMNLAQQYGIDLNAEAPQVDQTVQYLMNELNQLRQSQQLTYNQIQQREQEAAQSEMQAFASDPQHAHFEAVRGTMASLLETGQAKTLKEAYDKAVWLDDGIRQSLIEQQRKDAESKAMAQAQAQRARTAAVSVKGSSPAAGGIQTPKGSLRDQILASMEQLS